MIACVRPEFKKQKKNYCKNQIYTEQQPNDDNFEYNLSFFLSLGPLKIIHTYTHSRTATMSIGPK